MRNHPDDPDAFIKARKMMVEMNFMFVEKFCGNPGWEGFVDAEEVSREA